MLNPHCLLCLVVSTISIINLIILIIILMLIEILPSSLVNLRAKFLSFGRYGPRQPKSAIPPPHYYPEYEIWAIHFFCEKSLQREWAKKLFFQLRSFSSDRKPHIPKPLLVESAVCLSVGKTEWEPTEILFFWQVSLLPSSPTPQENFWLSYKCIFVNLIHDLW